MSKLKEMKAEVQRLEGERQKAKDEWRALSAKRLEFDRHPAHWEALNAAYWIDRCIENIREAGVTITTDDVHDIHEYLDKQCEYYSRLATQSYDKALSIYHSMMELTEKIKEEQDRIIQEAEDRHE
jgi:hypothetical protein